MNTKNDDLGKLLKLWFQSKKIRGGFNLKNPQGNISLIETNFLYNRLNPKSTTISYNTYSRDHR